MLVCMSACELEEKRMWRSCLFVCWLVSVYVCVLQVWVLLICVCVCVFVWKGLCANVCKCVQVCANVGCVHATRQVKVLTRVATHRRAKKATVVSCPSKTKPSFKNRKRPLLQPGQFFLVFEKKDICYRKWILKQKLHNLNISPTMWSL